MTIDHQEMVLRLLAALLAGAFIGYERSYHGRPAGIRTHALVCTASSVLMFVTVYEAHWVRVAGDTIKLDPTRMAQGIMTGIGFLGAGVIIKEGLTIRGLTTAASIWITAAIGILAGIGFYFPLALSAVVTLGVLSVFRWVESRVPTQGFYQFEVQFAHTAAIKEDALRALIQRHGFTIADLTHSLEDEGRRRRFSMVLRTIDRTNVSRLSEALEATETVLEFRFAPAG